jgi:GDP-D-mannose 3', 5'-epimerase
MRSDWTGPVNIGSEEMVTINQLVEVISQVSGKEIHKKHIEGPTGVRGRNSDNPLIRQNLDWAPEMPLSDGIAKTYSWIEQQVFRNFGRA